MAGRNSGLNEMGESHSNLGASGAVLCFWRSFANHKNPVIGWFSADGL